MASVSAGSNGRLRLHERKRGRASDSEGSGDEGKPSAPKRARDGAAAAAGAGAASPRSAGGSVPGGATPPREHPSAADTASPRSARSEGDDAASGGVVVAASGGTGAGAGAVPPHDGAVDSATRSNATPSSAKPRRPCPALGTPDGDATLTIVAWNVNGLLSRLTQGGHKRKGGRVVGHPLQLFEERKPDIVAISETHLMAADVAGDAHVRAFSAALERLGYCAKWNCATTGHHAGTAVFWRRALGRPRMLNTIDGSRRERGPLTLEGRLLVLEFDELALVTVYAPHRGYHFHGRDDKWRRRHEIWEPNLRRRLGAWRAQGKEIIVAGDLNACRDPELDICSQFKLDSTACNTPHERRDIERLLRECELQDVWRERNPDVRAEGWTYGTNIFNKDHRGCKMRLDYFLFSRGLVDAGAVLRVDSPVKADWNGSDHHPISATLSRKAIAKARAVRT